MSGTLELKLPPPLVGAIVAVSMYLAAWLEPDTALALPGRLVVCWLLVLAGIGVDLAGLHAFRRARTTINPMRPHATSTLVTSGIYRFTRNPMYLGMLLLLLAWAIWLSSLLALLLAAVYVVYLNRFQITPEERVLASRFGQDYADYRKQVRRWL